jgi:hypothetical protein
MKNMKGKAFSFKRLFLAYSFGFLPFALVLAVLSLLRIAPVHVNGSAYYGGWGFFWAILSVPFLGIIMSAVNWVFLNVGEYLYFSLRSIWNKK